MKIPTTLFIEPKQERKIKTALRNQKGCRIKMQKPYGGSRNSCPPGLLKGELLLNPAQWKKYQKAKPGKSLALPFQHKHLVENMHHKGGFLPLLAAALIPIISGVAGGLIEKEIAGSGLHPPKLVWCKNSTRQSTPVAFQIDPTPHGNGLYLSPWKGSRGNFKSGTGLYLSPYPHKIGTGVSLRKLEHGLLAHCNRFSHEQKKSVFHLM